MISAASKEKERKRERERVRECCNTPMVISIMNKIEKLTFTDALN